MATTKKPTVNKLRPGQFKFEPSLDFIVIEAIHIESKDEKKARLANLNIVGAGPAKNIIDLQNQSAKDNLTYAEYTKNAVDYFEGKHGFQGIVKGIGPKVVLEEISYRVGDKIYHRGQSGEPIVHNKRLYWMLKPHEIYGKAPKDEHEI
jgi:hypothetical protein